MKTLRLRLRPILALALTSLLTAVTARAQRPFVQEFAGATVVLTSGDTITGPLALHSDRDLLLLTMPDQTVRTVAALAVAEFLVKGEKSQPGNYYDQYYDFYEARRGYYYGNPGWGAMPVSRRAQRADTARIRVFRTFRWNRGNDYSDFKSPAFFEQLSRGPVVLLRRESLVERTMTANDPFFRPYYGFPMGGLPRGPIGTYVSVRDQFFLGTPQGGVVSLRSPKKDLLAYFKPQANQIERYAKENKLSFNDAHELAFIVNYANSLR
jgi:hypothetical protein